MSESNEVVTEPTLERRSRRRFSAADKKRLLAEADALPRGEQGAWLRRRETARSAKRAAGRCAEYVTTD